MKFSQLIENAVNTLDEAGNLEIIEGYCDQAIALKRDEYPVPLLKKLFNLAGEIAPASIANAPKEDHQSFDSVEIRRLISVSRTRRGQTTPGNKP